MCTKKLTPEATLKKTVGLKSKTKPRLRNTRRFEIKKLVGAGVCRLRREWIDSKTFLKASAKRAPEMANAMPDAPIDLNCDISIKLTIFAKTAVAKTMMTRIFALAGFGSKEKNMLKNMNRRR
jgi:hypothetical protein